MKKQDKYYQQNKDEINQQRRQKYRRNKEADRSDGSQLNYYERNKESLLRQKRLKYFEARKGNREKEKLNDKKTDNRKRQRDWYNINKSSKNARTRKKKSDC